jgi:general secretion pathway protein J
MTRARIPAGYATRGFTLVEVLVALVLLSLLTLGMASALHSLGDTQTRVQSRAQRAEHMAAVHRWLLTVAAHPVRDTYTSVDAQGASQAQRLRFDLQPQSLAWVGIMPARPAMGGQTEWRLALEPDATDPQRQHLVLRYRPRQPAPAQGFADWADAPAETLVADVQTLRIEARGARPRGWPDAQPWDDDWRADWPAQADSFPQALRIELADARGPWPVLLLPILPTVPSAEPASMAVIGGSPVVRGGR